MQIAPTYPLTSSQAIPVRGIVKAPYVIVNLSTEETVWVSQNSGMRIGEGTPIFPGTSVTWQDDDGFFAIATGNAEIITTKDVLDWQPNPIAVAAAILNSGILVIDRPTTLFDAAIAATDNSGFIDVSRYQSVYVVVLNDSGAANSLIYEFDKEEAGVTQILHQTWLNFHTGGQWSALIPCLGDTFRLISWIGSFDALVIGSNRPVDGLRQEISNPNDVTASTWLWSVFNTTLATANEYSMNIPPWFGEIEINIEFTCTAAPGISNLQRRVVDMSVPTARRVNRVAFTATPVVNIYHGELRFATSGAAERLVIRNDSGADFTAMNVIVTPVSGYGLVA